MKGKYKNSMPIKYIVISVIITIVGFLCFAVLFFPFMAEMNVTALIVAKIVLGVMAELALFLTIWFIYMRIIFSYNSKAKLPERIVEFIAKDIKIIDGKILDIGCGSGALSIACAKEHPRAYVVGVDTYSGKNRAFMQVCRNNRTQNQLSNVTFRKGSVNNLRCGDEAFDAIVSNYVFTRQKVKDRKALLKEAFRVLKKGGQFAIHDIFTKATYGDINNFMEELRVEGFQKVELVSTTKSNPITPFEANFTLLNKSFMLRGIK